MLEHLKQQYEATTKQQGEWDVSLAYSKVDNHVTKNQLLCSIQAEPVNKSTISFLKLNEISWGMVALNCYTTVSLVCSLM